MSPTTTSARRARLLGATLLAAVFVGGAFSGAAVDRMIASGAGAAQPPAEPDRREGRDEHRGYIFEQLDLAPEQRARIDAVLEHRRAQMDTFWIEARPRLRSIVDSAREDIREVLTPEQRAEYDRLRAEHEAAKERERDGRDREGEGR